MLHGEYVKWQQFVTIAKDLELVVYHGIIDTRKYLSSHSIFLHVVKNDIITPFTTLLH